MQICRSYPDILEMSRRTILGNLDTLLCLVNAGLPKSIDFLTITTLPVVPPQDGGIHYHALVKARRRRQRGDTGHTRGHRGLWPLAMLTPCLGPAVTMFFVTNPSTATCLYRAATRLHRLRLPWRQPGVVANSQFHHHLTLFLMLLITHGDPRGTHEQTPALVTRAFLTGPVSTSRSASRIYAATNHTWSKRNSGNYISGGSMLRNLKCACCWKRSAWTMLG